MKNRPRKTQGRQKLTRYHLDSQQAAASKRCNGRDPEPPTYRRFSSKTMFPAPYRARSHQIGLSDRLDGRYSSLHSFCINDLQYYSQKYRCLSTKMFYGHIGPMRQFVKLLFVGYNTVGNDLCVVPGVRCRTWFEIRQAVG